MAPRIITLVRHGQAHHNINCNYHLHDPYLTPLGEAQCQELSKEFPSEPPVDLLVSSPLKRTIQTTLFGFKKQVESGAKVELLAELQEAEGFPCDTGSSRDELEKEELFQGLDFSGLPDDWNSKALYVPLGSFYGRALVLTAIRKENGPQTLIPSGNVPESPVNGSGPDRKAMLLQSCTVW